MFQVVDNPPDFLNEVTWFFASCHKVLLEMATEKVICQDIYKDSLIRKALGWELEPLV